MTLNLMVRESELSCFSFQLPVIKELGDAAFDFVFEDSELLAKVTEGIDHVTCKKNI